MAEQVRVELCHESGCGLIVVDADEKQYRVDLMPDEVLQARESGEKSPAEFAAFLVDIDPKFTAAIEAVGAESIAQKLADTKLPKILREMKNR